MERVEPLGLELGLELVLELVLGASWLRTVDSKVLRADYFEEKVERHRIEDIERERNA